MKKILTLCTLFVILFGNTFAFTISQFEKKRNEYKVVIEKKLSYKLSKFDGDNLEKLQKLITKRIEKEENNTSLSDQEKLNTLSLLYAFQDIVLDYLENTPIVVKVIDDKRCTSCQTDEIINQLKEIPNLVDVKIEKKDFTDEGIEEYLKENNITKLPAFIFENNKIDQNIDTYLEELPTSEYSLQVGASFNPFIKRSEKGYLLLDETKYEEIKENSYIKGNLSAKITWIEYSDIECPFCAKLHNSGTPEDLEKKYGDDLNIIYNHFPLDFHTNAMSGAQIIECVGELKGEDTFYNLLNIAYSSEKSDKEFLVDVSVELGVNKENLEKCIDENKYEEKINIQQDTGSEVFGITGTPGNVLINNETLEYEVISGAYPTDSFEKIIDELLK